jgi:hypothetical protein
MEEMIEACRAGDNQLLSCTDDEMLNNMLFACNEAFVNTISTIKWCNYTGTVCKDGGSGKSDYCG